MTADAGRKIWGKGERYGRIFCLGGNYFAHRREMGIKAARPDIFVKVDGSLQTGDGPIVFPPDTENFHYEGEFVLLTDDVPAGRAAGLEDLLGIGVGLDLTRRDVQANARKDGRPWEYAKSFPGAARLADGFIDPHNIDLPSLHLQTRLNGAVVQSAALSDMILSPAEILSAVHAWMPLKRGDLIFTGTPEGVGPMAPGDFIEVEIVGRLKAGWRVVENRSYTAAEGVS